MKLVLSALGVATAATFALTAPAHANLAAPDAEYHATLGKYANFESIGYEGIGTFSDGFSTVTVGAQPSPFVAAHAFGNRFNGNPEAGGSVTYYVGVDGPDEGVFVPIDVSYRMSGSIALIGGAYDGFAQSELTLTSEYRGNRISTVFIPQSGNFNVSGTAAWQVASGTTGQVKLYTRAGFVVGAPNASGNADAFIDPVFTIASAFAASHPEYSLVFSQGVGNSAAGAVPEPATWALMVLGFGLVGSLRRRTGRIAA